MASGAEKRTRALVRERSGGICELGIPGVCLGAATNISHRQAKGQGGPWTAANCMDSCGSGTTGCHGWVEANPIEAASRGLRIASFVHESRISRAPVQMRTTQWPPDQYLLHEDGTITPCHFG